MFLFIHSDFKSDIKIEDKKSNKCECPFDSNSHTGGNCNNEPVMKKQCWYDKRYYNICYSCWNLGDGHTMET